MKRFSLLCVLAILCSLPAYSQFWISFGWNEPHCQNCLWMEQAMHLPARQAAEYHKIIHKYGQKIEKEARRDYRYWDRAITIGITAGVPFTMTIIRETTGMTQIDIGIVTTIVMTIGNQRNRISPNLKRIRRIGTIEKNGIIAMGERSNNSTIA